MTPGGTPFHKILIANRGEIALRVMRTAHALGYRTVAVYSCADANARHVREADEAVCIGEPLPAQSYLNIEAIVGAVRRSGADAVHPGYGFLAENADFAQACLDAGVVFIGPSPQAMRAMGNKAGAKRLMEDAGVRCIPGYAGDDQDPARLAVEAARIGYPVMIKAVAGGGGRGMRFVARAADFDAALRSAQSEAKNAFGDATVLLERALVNPRHIEIQIFADRHGNVIHLGERDCSVQRRHQKLIEESPAITPDLREHMGSAAVKAARAIDYQGAGTIEFLIDRSGSYYFMEMNTRLQVEHPVTEALTGLDLVAWQLKVATGEPLPLAQGDVRFSGHAIEVRLCAENAADHFMPQSGTIRRWRAPAAGPHGVRIEHALEDGASVPPYYDSMIAKLIGHGATREEARRRLIHGLTDLVVLGVTTNQAFLLRCLDHVSFGVRSADTGFIAEHLDTLLQPDAQADALATALGAALLVETAPGAATCTSTRRLTNRLPIEQHLSLDGAPRVVTLTHRGERSYGAVLDGVAIGLDLAEVDPASVRFSADGLMEHAAWVRDADQLWLHLRGRAYLIVDRTRAAAVRQAGAAGDGKLRASMNGRVVAVGITPGDRVAVGQALVTLEAMKMEHVHAAPHAGRVASVFVSVGEQVSAGRVLAEIEPEERTP